MIKSKPLAQNTWNKMLLFITVIEQHWHLTGLLCTDRFQINKAHQASQLLDWWTAVPFSTKPSQLDGNNINEHWTIRTSLSRNSPQNHSTYMYWFYTQTEILTPTVNLASLFLNIRYFFHLRANKHSHFAFRIKYNINLLVSTSYSRKRKNFSWIKHLKEFFNTI